MNKLYLFYLSIIDHFQEITLPSTEKEITEVVEKACHKLPVTVASQCDSFVKTYMADFIALLANRIDPSQVFIHYLTGNL